MTPKDNFHYLKEKNNFHVVRLYLYGTKIKSTIYH